MDEGLHRRRSMADLVAADSLTLLRGDVDAMVDELQRRREGVRHELYLGQRGVLTKRSPRWWSASQGSDRVEWHIRPVPTGVVCR